MSKNQAPTAKSTPAIGNRTEIAEISLPEAIVYWIPCQGIPPFVVEPSRLFFAAQAIVVIASVAVVLVLLLIF